MPTHTCIIALGANLGNREATFERALVLVEEQVGKVLKRSRWHLSKPLESVAQNQRDYLNGVVLIETEKTPEQVLANLQKIEKSLGRRREEETVRWGPRVIDLDLIAVDDLVLETPTLILPHPEMHKRDFVLLPLAEICPEWRHPLMGKSVKELLV